MTESPNVKFTFENNNVQPYVPVSGVTNVLARTTKGPFNDPSTLITTIPQFKRIFGKEVVPDGTVSNIERALKMGSKLRISRVEGGETTPAVKASRAVEGQFIMEAATAGAAGNSLTYTIAIDGTGTATAVKTGNNVAIVLLSTAKTVSDLITLLSAHDDLRASANPPTIPSTSVIAVSTPVTLTGGKDASSTAEFGVSKVYDIETNLTGIDSVLKIKLTNLHSTSGLEDNNMVIKFKIKTKEAGSNIVSEIGNNLDRNFFLEFREVVNSGLATLRVTQFTELDDEAVLTSSILNQSNLLTYTYVGGTGVPYSIDYVTLINFLENTPNITLEYTGIDIIGDVPDYTNQVSNMYDVVEILKAHSNWPCSLYIDSLTDMSTPVISIINEGNNGGASTQATWEKAFDAIKSYDTYHTIASHIHQHLTTDYIATLKNIGELIEASFDSMLFVEVPKANADGTLRTVAETKTALDAMRTTIGYLKSVAYFGGGINIYNEDGILKKSDVLGTVIGLADNSNSKYGPYYSFAGQSRGLVTDAKGPIIENLGGPSHIDILNELANSKLNLFVIKDTTLNGKQTMLWHNFTSTYKDSSDKFISVIGLQLFLKKNLRPILEKNLEEPNTFSMWFELFQEGKKIFDNLIGTGITEYTWKGDQDATKYSELVVNKEADVRNGKYKVIVSYKEIVSLQVIEMVLGIDSASGTITVE